MIVRSSHYTVGGVPGDVALVSCDVCDASVVRWLGSDIECDSSISDSTVVSGSVGELVMVAVEHECPVVVSVGCLGDSWSSSVSVGSGAVCSTSSLGDYVCVEVSSSDVCVATVV